jgi:pyruvate dehydrogenase E2 component (dihydrolipoamide acetyltransferase)
LNKDTIMPFEFRFPDVGEGITEGEIVRWLVTVGEAVRVDQPLAEIETDKAVVEIPAPRTGTILRLAVAEGETIQVGEILVVIGEEGAVEAKSQAAAPVTSESSDRADGAAASVSVVGALQESSTVLPPPPELLDTHVPPRDSRQRILAIPSVRKLARDLGVDLAQVTPTGPRGRIRREDVVQAASSQPTEAEPLRDEPVAAPGLAGREERDEYGAVTQQPLPALRRTIAHAMERAARTAVPISTTDEADVTELVRLRQRGRDAAAEQGIHVTLLPFIMKAVVVALEQHPVLNATLDDALRHLTLKHYYHLGIATDTPEGLIVPVVRDVDQKSILALAAEVQRLAELARERRVALADLRGGTFTISNYGAIGGLFATPMLHLPQVAILGVGKQVQKPVIHEGEVAVRTMLPLSLTFDHRAMDGAHAQRFLNELIAYLADPAQLMLRL